MKSQSSDAPAARLNDVMRQLTIIATEVVAVVALVTLFRTRGWMGKGGRS